MVIDYTPSLGFHAGAASDSWRQCLKGWSLALIEELRATESDERRRAASLLIPMYALALVVAVEVASLHAEVDALVRGRDDGWRSVPREARRLPPGQLTLDLIAASDPARVLVERVSAFARLIPICERLGFLDAGAREVSRFARVPTARNFLLARQSVRVGGAGESGAAPRAGASSTLSSG